MHSSEGVAEAIAHLIDPNKATIASRAQSAKMLLLIDSFSFRGNFRVSWSVRKESAWNASTGRLKPSHHAASNNQCPPSHSSYTVFPFSSLLGTARKSHSCDSLTPRQMYPRTRVSLPTSFLHSRRQKAACKPCNQHSQLPALHSPTRTRVCCSD
jgi:hypothetical protein